ncbi:aspartic proteinase CDR1-like [Lathyrus oleraceus]|uniref:aspartic proteinase CDR1-like n=1 Tax=Pisum sativum TaxID=3888 RepID=UPI0021D04339|nr:aspartic proteinase CDR1-like [Pisum sativum]
MSRVSSFIFIFFCLFSFIVCSHAINKGFSIELIHRDSYKSPLYNPTQTKSQQIINAIHRSISRSNSIDSQFSLTKNKHESSLTYESGEYIMSYYIGTPPFKVYGLFDSGSNLIWLQCKPCNTCYNQTSPIFNPSKSLSYQNIPCSSSRCKSTEIEVSCSNDRDACKYTLDYGASAKTQGDLILETITLVSTSGSIISFPKIMIGCGHNNSLFYSGKASGVIGLGIGPLSLIKQLGSVIDERFSYCLIDDRNVNLSSKLNFGDAAIVSGKNVVSTPMVKMSGNNQVDYYYLNLKAISVGRKRISYSGFKNKGINASTHNILLDSGATITFVPRHFYHRLESAIKKMVKLERFHDNTGEYNLCYNTKSKKSTSKPKFPIIIAHFSGGDVKLDSKGSFHSLSEGIECFAFFPHKRDLGVFGNNAQVNHLVGYDLKKNIVSFKPTDCSKY